MAKRLRDKGIEPMHPTTIAKIESGDRAVRIDEATGIADLFEISLDSLLGRKAGLDNDLGYALRALRDGAQKSVWDLTAIYNSGLRERLSDVLDLEFEGADELQRDGNRALDALDAAVEALLKVASFELPPEATVRLRDAMIQRAVIDELGKLLEGIGDDETKS